MKIHQGTSSSKVGQVEWFGCMYECMCEYMYVYMHAIVIFLRVKGCSIYDCKFYLNDLWHEY